MPDPFADAQAWYDRAQRHISEYRELAHGNEKPIWDVRSKRVGKSRWVCSLKFNRDRVTLLKPVACEAANALFQALDNIIAVGARAANVPRGPKIAWPWALEGNLDPHKVGAPSPAIDSRLQDLSRAGVPDVWLDLIRETFAAQPMSLIHIDVVKEVSLSGKHWELIATGMDVAAVAWGPANSHEKRIVNISQDHFETNDEFVFYDGSEEPRPSCEMVMGIKLVAEGKLFEPDPGFAFDETSRFVRTALDKARAIEALDG